MAYKTISSSYIFKSFNNVESIQMAMNGQLLGQKELAEQMMMIQKYIKSPFKMKILSALQDGTIKLRYVKDLALVQMPFILGADGSINILVSSYGRMREDGMVSVDYRKLYTLMECGYIAKKFISNYERYRNDSILIKNGAEIYSNMFVKPINRRFNLHLDRNRENTLLFLAAKFYLKNVLGLKNNDIIFNTAMSVCKAGNHILLQEADSVIPDSAYVDLKSFFNELKEDKLNLGLKNIQLRDYLSDYLALYNSSATFSLEMMPYFLYVINAGISSMGLVNNYALEDIVEKGGAKIVSRFLN